MITESEAALERRLINDLEDLGYDRIAISDEASLLKNFQQQLSKHNHVIYSDNEFSQILIALNSGSVYDRAHILRDRITLTRDDGSIHYVELMNTTKWCQNNYQVTHQVTMQGRYENRYDVTLLVNGLPLCQIELKRRGMELKEAFNQVERYRTHSYSSGYGLFQYVQLFIISNGENTKYFANGDGKLSFDFTCYWSDIQNRIMNQLEAFTREFLEPCHLSKMIANYMVLTENKTLMVLRPYQYHAVEAIIDRVKNSDRNGYIWHTTGSGKTLTSFKASQLIAQMEEIEKILFVVDRKDLDVQTIREFNKLKEGSVDSTTSTKELLEQFQDPDKKLIVTTLQKLNHLLNGQRNGNENRYSSHLSELENKKVVIIFDECHRSQFGKTHRDIKHFFKKHQMIGFTGTPILKENALNQTTGETTKDLFDEPLHKYLISDAIKDKNVLSFSVDYVAEFTTKEEIAESKVSGINTSEIFESSKWIREVTKYIIRYHDTKTSEKKFNAILCTSSIATACLYYAEFKQQKDNGAHDLNIATVFSFAANEEIDHTSDDFYGSEGEDPHSRDKLERCISDYNQQFGTKFSTNTFENYNRDLAQKVKDQTIDLLIVVNMYLTGFDSPRTNTLYVDKNLRYHGLIQAFSRTNRLVDSTKPHGNIVCFRSLKKETDEAIALFANKDAADSILIKPYKDYLQAFHHAVKTLESIVPTPDSVHQLESDAQRFEFIKAFRDLLRLHKILESFQEFQLTQETARMNQETFNGYASQYADLKHEVSESTDKVSILKDIDFQLELLVNDRINVDYILWLLYQNKQSDDTSEKIKNATREAHHYLDTDPKLSSKKELVLQFVNEQRIYNTQEEMQAGFTYFMRDKKEKAFTQFAIEHMLDLPQLNNAITGYEYRGHFNQEDLTACLPSHLKLLERRALLQSLEDQIPKLLEQFKG